MPNPPDPEEGVWDRACLDFGHALTSSVRWWPVLAFILIVGGAIGAQHGTWGTIAGGALGILACLGMVFLWSLMRASVHQRNELRASIEVLNKARDQASTARQVREILDAAMGEWVSIISAAGHKTTALGTWSMKLTYFVTTVLTGKSCEDGAVLVARMIDASTTGTTLDKRLKVIQDFLQFERTLRGVEIRSERLFPGQEWETWTPSN